MAESTSTPSPAADGGRDATGKFTSGNRFGLGNPFAKQTGRLRAAMVGTVTEQDMRDITAKLVQLARSGSVAAAKLLFDRLFGKEPADLIELVAEARDFFAVRVNNGSNGQAM